MAKTIDLGFAKGFIPEEHETSWVWMINPAWADTDLRGEAKKEVVAKWRAAVDALTGWERYWVKHGGWTNKANAEKFLRSLKKKYGFQVLGKATIDKRGVGNWSAEAKNAIKSKSMDW